MIFNLTGKAAFGWLRETPVTRSVVVLVMERARKRDRNVGSSGDAVDVILLSRPMGRLPDGFGGIRVDTALDVQS